MRRGLTSSVILASHVWEPSPSTPPDTVFCLREGLSCLGSSAASLPSTSPDSLVLHLLLVGLSSGRSVLGQWEGRGPTGGAGPWLRPVSPSLATSALGHLNLPVACRGTVTDGGSPGTWLSSPIRRA